MKQNEFIDKVLIARIIAVCTLLLSSLIVNAQMSVQTYPLKQSLLTKITGKLPKLEGKIEFVVYDRAKFTASEDDRTVVAKVDSSGFTLALDLKNPVYIYPKYPGAAAYMPGSIFNGILDTKYVSYGLLIEPGDASIFIW